MEIAEQVAGRQIALPIYNLTPEQEKKLILRPRINASACMMR